MADYISREAAISEIMSEPTDAHFPSWYAEKLKQVPAADVVARDCYDRVLSENDTMRKQLAQIGKKAGDKMDDVRPVVKGTWEKGGGSVFPMYVCSLCHAISLGGNFCPNCGADMREPNLDTTKGDDHD